MSKVWFICMCLFALDVNAKTSAIVPPLKADEIDRIFWLTPERTQSIVYARFEMFDFIRDTVKDAMNNKENWPTDDSKITTADLLLLHISAEERLEHVYLLRKAISYRGVSYQVNEEVLVDLRRVNAQRIEKGDLVTYRGPRID